MCRPLVSDVCPVARSGSLVPRARFTPATRRRHPASKRSDQLPIASPLSGNWRTVPDSLLPAGVISFE